MVHGSTAVFWTLVVIARSGAAVGTEHPSGTALRLRFDFASVQGTIIRDASGNGHDGTLEGKDGQLPVIAQTPYGPALILAKDKGQGIRVPFAEDLVGADGLTVMAWVKPDNARSHLAIVANKGDRVPGRPADGYRLSVFWNRALMDLGFGEETGEQLTTPEWSVQNGYWVHVAMTFDGQDMVLYQNATEAARKRLPERRTLTPRGGSFTVGKFFWNDAYPFVGSLRDVRIYAKRLTEAEIFAAATESLGE